jgi:hypothetical protein
MCILHSKSSTPLNVLLTNGRFPVSLALARQLKLAGHHVYVVGKDNTQELCLDSERKCAIQIPCTITSVNSLLM